MDQKIIKDRIQEINDIIYQFLPEPDEYNTELCEAVNYSVKAGGKRLRPMFVQEMYRLFAQGRPEPDILHAFMAAIEFIHTYSLIHDDLPAMDNDEYRRGELTTHAKYGEAFGVLAGDALLNYAFEIILEKIETSEDPEDYMGGISAARILASKAGIFGMVGGQSVDVYADKHPEFEMDSRAVDYIYKNKTSALLEASLMIGAVLGQAYDIEIELAEKMGSYIGMAFQIRDDILDITGDQALLGKPVGSDAKNEKQTFVSIHGLQKSQEMVKLYSDKALEIYDSLRCRNPFLKEIIIQLIDREK